MGTFKMHLKMADYAKNESQQHTPEAQLTMFWDSSSHFYFHLADSHLSFL